MQQTETCRDYLRGVCVRGPSCIYGHPPGLQGSQRAQSQICRDYLKGTCVRGPACVYQHVGQPATLGVFSTYANQPAALNPYAGYLGVTGAVVSHPQQVASPAAVQAPSNSLTLLYNGKETEICKDFLRTKTCTRSECRFLHVQVVDEENKSSQKRTREDDDDTEQELKRLRSEMEELQQKMTKLEEENQQLREQIGDATGSVDSNVGVDRENGPELSADDLDPSVRNSDSMPRQQLKHSQSMDVDDGKDEGEGCENGTLGSGIQTDKANAVESTHRQDSKEQEDTGQESHSPVQQASDPSTTADKSV